MFSGLLPPIPNLQLGYVYSFNRNYGAGRVTGDYLKPFSLNRESFVFGEVHAEMWNFWGSSRSGYSGGIVNNRVDLSLGGGYRKFFGNQALIGFNGFYDTTRLTGTWFPSGSLGVQAAWLLPGSDALDINFNWYGQLLNGNEWVNTFRYGPSNYDFEAGYSHELWNGGPDLRLKAKGYHFDVGTNLNGYSAGAELKSRDGMFVLKYEASYDRLNNTYQTIGGYVNVGLQLENLLSGLSPFTAPTPIFRSPRSLSYMANQPVQRNWSQPSAVVVSRAATTSSSGGSPTEPCVFRDITGGILYKVIPGVTYDYTISYGTGYTTVPGLPADPDLSNLLTVTVQWCGLKNYSSDLKFQGLLLSNGVTNSGGKYTGVGRYNSGPQPPPYIFLEMNASSGSFSFELSSQKVDKEFPQLIQFYPSVDLKFEEGGGIAFQIKRN
jgi:hypothetical protein